MSAIMMETHKKILRKATKRALITHGILVLALASSILLHWANRTENSLIAESYQSVRYHLIDRQSRYALLQVLRNKPLTIGQALQVADVVIDESRANGVPIHMILGVMDLESEFLPNAVSSAGARGLMQVMPERWNEYVATHNLRGVSTKHDPAINVTVGIRYLGDLFKEYKDWNKVLKVYGGYVKASPDAYIRIIMARANKYKTQLEENSL